MSKLKLLAAAVGLAVVAGQAAAAIRLPGDAGGNGSELFAVIYDTESKASFMKDLGLELQNFLPTPAGSGVTTPGTFIPFNITADSNWSSFLALTDGSPTLRFMVAGADTTGGATPGAQRFMATGGATNPFGSLTNAQVSGNLAAAPIKFLGDNQNRGTHNALTPVSDNGSSVTTDDQAINFGKAGTMTQNWNGVLGSNNMTGALGESLNFYFVTRSSVGGNGGPPTRDQYDNAIGPAKWTFSQAAGGGDYTLTYTAPIPEPETWALMLAGMALVGGVARRRARG
jgi:hypothetical protein